MIRVQPDTLSEEIRGNQNYRYSTNPQTARFSPIKPHETAQ